MTAKERIIAAVEGKPNDCLPFLPRLDNWYRANKMNGTLPARFKNATLREITDECGLGYHAINPDYLDLRVPDGDIHIGLGLYDINLTPYTVKLHNVGVQVRRDASGKTFVEYDTPKGKISTCVIYDDRMRKSGISISVILDHAVKTYKDLPAVAYILQNAEVLPNYEKLADFRQNFMGDRGLTVGLAGVYCSPFHYLVKELMSMETFYFTMADNLDEMEEFAAQITPYLNKLVSIAADSPCDALLCGSNFDSYVTAPSMFEEYILPYLQNESRIMHEKGKYHICHTDGENTGLLDKYTRCGFDIADSICPSPMTKCSLEQIYQTFNGQITIWGGIPSICMLEENMDQREFERTLDNLLSSIGDGSHMIFSVADTLPPAADFERVLYVQKKLEEFGPVPGAVH